MRRQVKKLGWVLLGALPAVLSRAIIIRRKSGRWPRLRDPRGLNDKINWRILHDHRALWDWTCDKLAAREHASRLSPGILLPEVLWSGTDVREIASLPIDGRWILKSNSSSRDVIIGQGRPDVEDLAGQVAAWDDDFQDRALREYAYRHARRLVVMERWLGATDEAPVDYKIYVFHGVAKYIQVHRNRFIGHRTSIFTPAWERVDAGQSHIKADEITVERPERLDELLARAEQIAAPFDFLRVDLYETPDGVWFGETTPYSWSGTRPFWPEAFELELGSYWTLPDRALLK